MLSKSHEKNAGGICRAQELGVYGGENYNWRNCWCGQSGRSALDLLVMGVVGAERTVGW